VSGEAGVTFAAYASVVLDLALDKPLEYGVTEELSSRISPGVRVEVPVRGKIRQGTVYAVLEKPSFPKLKAIHGIVGENQLLNSSSLQLAQWIATYYNAPLGKVLKSMLPAAIRSDKGHKEQLFVTRNKTRKILIELTKSVRPSPQAEVLDVMLKVTKGILLSELLEKAGTSRSPVDTLVKKGALAVETVRLDRSPLADADVFPSKAKKLSGEQQVAYDKILSTLDDRRFEAHLLFGVTGSGKTEVYLQAIAHCLEQKRGVIMLVPEIALTEQTIERFRSRFGNGIAVLHHRLSVGERHDEWHRIRRGDARIVIGARSAIFSPVDDLGLIIVDEEHEQTYKQSDEAPCYHARNVAVVRGKFTNSAVILGSATPSIESFQNASSGKYTLSTLSTRPSAFQLPKVQIVDMKREYEKAGRFTSFSEPLLNGIEERYKKGEQTILFLNRRGYHTSLLCQGCGEVVRCPHCDVSLTLHRHRESLDCHLCDYTLAPPRNCPSCKNPNAMKYKGVGTEQVERSLHAIFPEVRTLRVDADTTRHKGSHHRLLSQFRTGKADVMIGTQMIAKGLHFPEVTLVGVLNSDATLNIPDFRASEWVFQLITQVSGRAGRGAVPGEVIIQTMVPENGTVCQAASQDFPAFFEEEIDVRRAFDYPPFTHFVKLLFSGLDESHTCRCAEELRDAFLRKLPPAFQVYPVGPAGHAKVRDRYRFLLLVRGPSPTTFNKVLNEIRRTWQPTRGVRLSVDVDPTSTFF
jgi:primosomal protein N' (replication factor Y)